MIRIVRERRKTTHKFGRLLQIVVSDGRGYEVPGLLCLLKQVLSNVFIEKVKKVFTN